MIYYEELVHTIMETKSHNLLSVAENPGNLGSVNSSLKAKEDETSQLNQQNKEKRIYTSFLRLLV